MEKYKNKTIALVLASVITVAGSFAAENYQNSLMGLEFNSSADKGICMVLQTKTGYTGNVSPIKKDANTYVLMLPDFDSKAPSPNLSNVSSNIESVNIRTMPYSANGKGYTKITIKTTGNFVLNATSCVYVPSQEQKAIADNNTQAASEHKEVEQPHNEQSDYNNKNNTVQYEQNNNQNNAAQYEQNNEQEFQDNSQEQFEQNNNEESYSDSNEFENSDPGDKNYYLTLMVLWVAILVAIGAFLYQRSKEKMKNIIGESLELDVEDEEKKENKKQEAAKSKIKETIKKLDKAYSKSNPLASIKNVSSQPAPVKKTEETLEIVDLDELFKEQKKNTPEENYQEEDEDNAFLDDFLEDFSFDEEIPEESSPGYDTEFYDKVINDNTIHFSKNDIKCIKDLLSSEIYDETLRDIKKYAISNPIEEVRDPQRILEDLAIDLKISHDIIFTHDDINALKKLICVELDENFLTDLRTNPQRTKEAEKEIANHITKRIADDIVTLKVKDTLPDLSKKEPNQKLVENQNTDKQEPKATQTLQEIKKQTPQEPSISPSHTKPVAKTEKIQKNKIRQFVSNGVKYEILAITEIKKDCWCYLAKSEKEYLVLSYYLNKFKILKRYETLDNINLQTRLFEKPDETTERYMIRTSHYKFVVDVTNDNIKYVMDLC